MSALPQHKGVSAYVVLDPVIDVDKPVKWLLPQGTPDTAFQNLPAPNQSVAQQNIQALVPDMSIIDREVVLNHDVNIVFKGTCITGSTLINIGSFDALRKNPMQRQMSTLKALINNDTIDNQPIYYINNFAWYESDHLEDTDLSTSPQYQDRFAEYNQYLNLGSVKNCLGAFGDNERTLRGSYLPYSTDYNNSTGASMNFNFDETLQLSPLTWGLEKQKGFVGINNFQVQASFNSSSQPMIWSHANGTGALSNLTSVAWTYNSQPTLKIKYLKPNSAYAPLDKTKPYYYEFVYPYINSQLVSASLAPLATLKGSLNLITLAGIPRGVMVYFREQVSTEGVTSTDTLCYITFIKIQFMQRQGILDSATAQELYKRARKNGYKGSWIDWSEYSGSPLLLMVGDDIPLPNGEGASQQGDFQVQVQSYTIQSLYPTRSVPIEAYTIPIYEGIYTIEKGFGNAQNAVLSARTIVGAPELPRVDANEVRGHALGGSLFDKVKSFVSRALPVAKKLAPVAEHLAKGSKYEKHSKTASQLLSGFGLAEGCEQPGMCGHDETCMGKGGCGTCNGVGRVSKSQLYQKMVGHGLQEGKKQVQFSDFVEEYE